MTRTEIRTVFINARWQAFDPKTSEPDDPGRVQAQVQPRARGDLALGAGPAGWPDRRAGRDQMGGGRRCLGGRSSPRRLGVRPGSGKIPPAALAPWQPQQQQRAEPLPFRREEPAQLATIRSHWGVPFLWSLTTGGIVFALGLVGAYYTSWEAVPAVLGAALVVMGLTFARRTGALDVVMWRTESFVGRDISGDGQIGRPQPEPEPTVIHARVEEPGRTPRDLFLRFGVSPALFGELVRAALADMRQGRGLWPEAEWSGRIQLRCCAASRAI